MIATEEDVVLAQHTGSTLNLGLTETVRLWTRDESQRVSLPRSVAHVLVALLGAADGRRLIAFSNPAVTAIAGVSKDTAKRAIDYLERIDLVTFVERATLRRVRILKAPNDRTLAALSERQRLVFSALLDLAGGSTSVYLSAVALHERTHLPMKVNSQVMIGLVQRGYVEQMMESPFPLQIYRVDVRRRPGRGLQLTRIIEPTNELQPFILRDRRSAVDP